MEFQSDLRLRCVTTQCEIEQALLHSRDHGNVVAITAVSSGPSLVITAVDEIIEIDNERIVLLMEVDLLGIRLPESNIPLKEIIKVYPLKTNYNDAFRAQMQQQRRNCAGGTKF